MELWFRENIISLPTPPIFFTVVEFGLRVYRIRFRAGLLWLANWLPLWDGGYVLTWPSGVPFGDSDLGFFEF